MSHTIIATDIMLIPYDDAWVTWIPAVDTCTQGDSPENAVGMAIDSLRFVVHWDMVNRVDCFRPKRVEHPLRRGRESHVKTDEHFEEWTDFRENRGRWDRTVLVPADLVTPSVGICFVCCATVVNCRGGIVDVNIDAAELYIVSAADFVR